MKLYADVIYRKAHYSDRQFRTLMTVYSTALTLRGSLPPRVALEAMLGKDDVDFLFSEGDLEADDEGVVVVHGWDIYQSRDLTAAERQRRHREKIGHADVTRDQRVTSSSSSTSSEEDSTKTTTFSTQPTNGHYPVPDSDMDSLDAYYELTRFRPWGQFSGDKLRVAMQEYGDSTTTTALRVEFAKDSDRKTVLDRALARLAKQAEKARLERPAKPKARVAPIDKAAYDAAYRDLLVVRPQEEQG